MAEHHVHVPSHVPALPSPALSHLVQEVQGLLLLGRRGLYQGPGVVHALHSLLVDVGTTVVGGHFVVDVEAEVGEEEVHHHHAKGIGITEIVAQGLVHHLHVEVPSSPVEGPQATLVEDMVAPIATVIVVTEEVEEAVVEDVEVDPVVLDPFLAHTLHVQGPVPPARGPALPEADPQAIQSVLVVQGLGLLAAPGLHFHALYLPGQGAVPGPSEVAQCRMIRIQSIVVAVPVALVLARRVRVEV